MKTLMIFCFVTGALASCEKDDDCIPGFLDAVIVGEWRVSSSGSSDGDVVFHANGSFEDDDESLVYNTFGDEPFSALTYFVDSDAQIRIHGDLSTTNDLEFIVPVGEYGCDEISLSVLGVDYTLKRK